MTRILAALAALGISSAAPAFSQSSATLTVSPIPDNAESRFCYYNGLAFSSQALLTVDVPYRREDPAATQKRLMKCVAAEDGRYFWLEFDLESGGLIQQ